MERLVGKYSDSMLILECLPGNKIIETVIWYHDDFNGEGLGWLTSEKVLCEGRGGGDAIIGLSCVGVRVSGD